MKLEKFKFKTRTRLTQSLPKGLNFLHKTSELRAHNQDK